MDEKYCKVLIVDDEYIIRQGIAYMIHWESEGFKIIGEASNGEDALKKIEECKPHIVLTDIVMPKMDGMELTKIICEKYPEIRIIILSSYSDFDYVRNTFKYGAVDYILKPTLGPDIMLETLKKAASNIEGMVLHSQNYDRISIPLTQYILGYLDELDKKSLDSYFINHSYVMLLTNLAYFPNKNEIKNFFKHKLEKISDCRARSFSVNEEIMVCIYSFEEKNYEALLSNIQAAVKGKNFFILSNVFYDIYEVRSIYTEKLLPSLENRFYHKNKSLLIVEEKNTECFLDKFDNREFSNLLSTAHFYEALEKLFNYIKKLLENKVNENELKAFVSNKLYNFISVLEENGFNENNIRYFKLECLSKVESAIYAEDFMNDIVRIFEDFKTIIDEYELNADQATMNKIMQYVYEHYQDSLTLNDLAKRFNFSYQYLSTYFSSRNGNTFIEYLNNIRIEEASKLLKKSNIAISDIGIKVGYSDHSYFCKVFKKYKGMTPSEYRKQ